MNTDNNSLAEHLERMARDMEYPPLNGGPTQEEIIGALKAAADIVGEYEHDENLIEDLEDLSDEVLESNDKLRSALREASDKLDGVYLEMMKANRAGELTGAKVGVIMDRLMELIEEIRRA